MNWDSRNEMSFNRVNLGFLTPYQIFTNLPSQYHANKSSNRDKKVDGMIFNSQNFWRLKRMLRGGREHH